MTPEQIKRRNELMKPFIKGDLDSKYDILYFDNLDNLTLDILIKEKFADPEECQNSAPSIQAYFEFMQENTSCRAHGYIVSPTRDDARISIEGLEGAHLSSDELDTVIRLERCADEFEFNRSKGSFRSWWD